MSHVITIEKVIPKSTYIEYLLTVNGFWEIVEISTLPDFKGKIIGSSIPKNAAVMPYVLSAIVDNVRD